MSGTDPTAIEVVVVTAEDVVTALEANTRDGDQRTVLRITPPFRGRMRARIHVETEGEYADRGETEAGGDPRPVHVPPTALVDAPPFPDPDDTEDELRAGPEEYTPERHRQRHVERIEQWRETVRASIEDTAVLELSGGSHRVAVRVLG